MPSPDEAAQFQNLLTRLATQATMAVAVVWEQVHPSDVDTAFLATVEPYTAGAAVLAAQWYQQLAPEQPFAVSTVLPQRDALAASARWATTQPNPVEAVQGATERYVFNTSRETILDNAAREGVRWARYASANACPWCRILATRSAVYHTKEAAAKSHDNCHCIAVPVRRGDTYTPPDYVKGWEQDYNTARREAGSNLDDIVNYLRRTAYN